MEMYAEEILLSVMSSVPLMSSLFAGMHTGEEFRDGTIRNKIISGSSRFDIFLSAVGYTVVWI